MYIYFFLYYIHIVRYSIRHEQIAGKTTFVFKRGFKKCPRTLRGNILLFRLPKRDYYYGVAASSDEEEEEEDC